MKLRSWLSALLSASLLTIFAGHAHAQWTWLYPTPHGNNLHDVVFLNDQTAIAVGDVGTIMVSNNAGLTWQTLFRTNSIATKLNHIDRIDDLSAVVVGDNGVILKTVDGGNSWTTPPSGTTAALNDVSFWGAVGIAIDATQFGPHVMLRSTNGGDTWSPVPNAPSPFYGVDLATPLIGYGVMDFLVLKTVDGGLTWAGLPNAPYPHGGTRIPISFADASNGVIGGGISSIYVTHDGGTSWTGQVIGTVFVEGGSYASDLELRSPSSVGASVVETMCDVYTGGNCSDDGKTFRSANNGVTWAYDLALRALRGVATNTLGVVVSVGDAGVINRYAPPGTSQQVAGTTHWNPLTDPGHLAFRDAGHGALLATSTRDVYAGPTTENVVLHTETAGASWDLATWGWPNGSMKDIAYATGSSDLYAVAHPVSGTTTMSAVLKSIDAGATWSTIWSNNQNLNFMALEFASSSHGVAVGRTGSAVVIDGGAVTPITIPGGIQGLAFADASVVVAVGGTGSYPAFQARIIRSVNGGTTWSTIPTSATQWLSDVAFANPSTGVAVGPAGIVFRTTDSGVSWTQVSIPTADYISAVAFSGSYGMAVGGYNGSVIETEDAGLTWTSMAPPATGLLTDVVVFGAHHALVAGPELTVLEYRLNPVPTRFASFKAVVRDQAAELQWDVSTDENLATFSVIRTWGTDQRVIASGLPVTSRSFRDTGLVPGQTYQYDLLAIDNDGSTTRSMPVKVTLPNATAELLPNQPNPFNPVTTIRFVVPEKMRVTISVHDVAGRVVATLLDDLREPGTHELTWNAEGMASGIYFARMHAGKTDVSRKMVLLK